MTEQPVVGQLRGVGLRLDPESILFAPEETGGLVWGYTIVDRTAKPAMFMNDEWTQFVPEGVWLQMLDAWDNLINTIKKNPEKFEYYLRYPEIKEAVDA